ncbi:asparaginase [uncultured Bartonella sp.]|uniref:asparaginase n=1 Tax=uncultured Bartonella sp. TaxID=104108 RepID=UPI0026330641|nr:asparaginase [uncultured Bartonella sp.]
MTILPTIAIGALGGTIAMVEGKTTGIEPQLSAQMLVKSVPELSGCAKIHAETLAKLPSCSLTFAELFAALAWARTQLDNGASGVVLTQGTDTLEETSFFLSLYWDRQEPLVVTGAMRPPMAAGADGPANILSSVIVAKDKNSKNRGVLVVMNDEIHSPYWVRKSHSLKVETFQSGFVGSLGTIVENRPVFFSSSQILPNPVERPKTFEKKVALVEMCLSSGHDHLKLIFESGLYHGVVIAGFGTGHVSFSEAEVISTHADKIPIIVASRAYNGTTTCRTYGYRGAEIDLIKNGVIMAGWLSPLKARLLLWALLAAGDNRTQIVQKWHHWQIC